MDFDQQQTFSFLSFHPSIEEEEGEEEEEEEEEEPRATYPPLPPIFELFASETDHMPSRQKLDHLLPLRLKAVSLLLQAQREFNMRCFVPYLAINYMDRFLSRREMPIDKPWIVELLSVACLSLASKMTKTHFSLCDVVGIVGVVCDAETIQRMELLVLSTLDWRMRSVTPFSFLAFFLGLFQSQDPPSLSTLRARATQVVFELQAETRLLDHKPSTIAASVLLTAAHELFPLQLASFHNSIISCSYVNREDLLKCCNLVEEQVTELEMENNCVTPVSVLRCRHLCGNNSSSSESEITGENSDARSRDIGKKKPRISGFYGDYVAPLIIMPSTMRK